jgi:putative NADH-flavin reductase
MHVFLIGATGPTGQILLDYLLKDGHSVTALLRTPDKIKTPSSPLFHMVQGDVMSPATYQDSLGKVAMVVSLLGTGRSNKPTRIYSAGGAAILEAMRTAGVKKLITLTSGGVQEDDPTIQGSFFYKHIGLWWLRHIYSDMKQWEAILEEQKDIDWVCIRPTYLIKGPKTGKYRVQKTYAPRNGWKISRADLAHFIVSQLSDREYIHQKPVIAY